MPIRVDMGYTRSHKNSGCLFGGPKISVIILLDIHESPVMYGNYAILGTYLEGQRVRGT